MTSRTSNRRSTRKQLRRRSKTKRIPFFEPLEQRALLTTFVDAFDTTADGVGCGSFANPCNTIQAGVDAAPAGGEVYVSKGLYFENVTIEKSLHLRAEVGEVTILPPGGLDGLNVNSPAGGSTIDVTIEDIAVTGAVLGIQAGSVGDLQLINVGSTSNSGDGLAVATAGTVRIDGGTFGSNGDHGIIISGVTGEVRLTNGVSAGGNFSEGLEVTDAGSVVVEGGSFTLNVDDGIAIDLVPGLTRIGLDGVAGASILSNGANGLNITRSGTVFVDRATLSSNFMNGISMSMVDDVVLDHVRASLNSDAGTKIHGATSVEDRDGEFEDNDDHGLQLIDISGNVTLNRTIAEDNDANFDGTGDGLNATPEDTSMAIGGDLAILGARLSDTDGISAAANQERGAFVDAVGGIATIRDSFHTVKSVSATGNAVAGLVLMEGTTAALTGGSYTDNGGFGIKLEKLDEATISLATATGNGMNGLDVRMTTDVTVDGGDYSTNGSDGIELAANAAATVDGVSATANGEHGVDAADSGEVDVKGGIFEDNGMSGVRVVASGAVTLSDSVSASKNKNGVHVTAVASFSDTDGVYVKNTEHGLLLEDIPGDVDLTRTTAENNAGLGVLAAPTAGASAIGGDFVVAGGTFGHTIAALPQQDIGIFADGVGGEVIFKDAVGPAQSVLVEGNEFEGVLILEGTTSSITGGTFSKNGGDGLELAGFNGAQTLTDVTAELNDESGLNISASDDVTVSGGTFSTNGANGISLFMNADLDVSGVTAADNGPIDPMPNVGVLADTSTSLALSDLTLTGNDAGGGLIAATPTVSFTATTGNTVDAVTLTGTSITHTRAGAAQDPITYGGVVSLAIDTDDSDDDISVSLAGLPAAVSIDAGEQTDEDSLTVTATAAADTLTLTAVSVSDGSTVVSYSEVEDLTVDAGAEDDEIIIDGSSTTVLGGAGDDTFTVNASGTHELILDGQEGSDSYFVHLGNVAGAKVTGPVTIDDSGTGVTNVDKAEFNGGTAGDSFVVGPKQATRDATETLNYDASLEELKVQGFEGNDSFDVTPADDTTINIDGGSPTGVPVGDSLTVQANGLAASKTSTTVSVDSKKDVNYTDIEKVTIVGEASSVPATDINVLSFGTASAAGPSDLVVSYDISIGAAPAFEFAFFTSDDARFDGGDTEVGTRVTISAASALSTGIHTMTFDHPSLDAALADLDAEFVLIVADPDDAVPEADETNNDNNFIGVFHRSTTSSPLVLRGRDDTDRNLDDDPNDAVSVRLRGRSVLVTGDLTPIAISVPRTTVSEVRAVMQGGDDEVRVSGRLALKALGGAGDDTLRGGDLSNVLLGGAGDDDLRGGRSHDQLIGGDGDDTIRGSRGGSLIVGGLGADDLRGDSGSDIIIAGRTIYDETLAALDAVLAKWRATPRGYAARVARVTGPTASMTTDPFLAAGTTVFDDQVTDRVRGGSSHDLFFADLDLTGGDDDDVRDKRRSETLIDLGELV